MSQPANRLVAPSEDRLTEDEFDTIRQLVYDTFGLSLNDTKRSLVVGRLNAVLVRENIPSFSDYIARVRKDSTGRLLSELVNRLSTNHTFFNREHVHFDFLRRTALPEVIATRKSARTYDLRMWCAASSYGHEAYMLGMIIRQVLGVDYSRWQAGLLATDINVEVLEVAKRGNYPAHETDQIPGELRGRYFARQPDGSYTAKPELARDITFRRFNLMNERFPFRQPFDITFCRNVMIYFDVATKSALARRIHQHTVPGGYLFIGAAESLPNHGSPFTKVSPGVYRKV